RQLASTQAGVKLPRIVSEWISAPVRRVRVPERVAALSLIAVMATAVLLSGCGDHGSASGIRGIVGLGGCRPGDGECFFRPGVASQCVVRFSDGRVVKEFTSQEDGSFKVGLPPGKYILRAVDGKALGSLAPLPFLVRPARFT